MYCCVLFFFHIPVVIYFAFASCPLGVGGASQRERERVLCNVRSKFFAAFGDTHEDYNLCE